MSVSYTEKAISLCHYIHLLYEDEPVKVNFSIDRNSIKFFLYYNPGSFEDVDDFYDEINAGLRSFNLLREGMGLFMVGYLQLKVVSITNVVGNIYH